MPAGLAHELPHDRGPNPWPRHSRHPPCLSPCWMPPCPWTWGVGVWVWSGPPEAVPAPSWSPALPHPHPQSWLQARRQFPRAAGVFREGRSETEAPLWQRPLRLRASVRQRQHPVPMPASSPGASGFDGLPRQEPLTATPVPPQVAPLNTRSSAGHGTSAGRSSST